MKNLTLILTIAIFAWTNVLFAQSKKVNGRVNSPSNENLIGALVMLKGTTNAVATDFEGKFSLNIPENTENPILVISFMGYNTQEVSLEGKDYIDVVLESSSETLNEIVVTAFGVSKDKRDLGYSTQSIEGADLIQARQPNPVEGLVGKIAGLNIGTNQEMLGRPNIELRGNTGIMYVVDGVPINSDSWNISPDDIETYTVLKGPNAAALYGFRGQNGAILITTKRGTKSTKGFHVSYNTSVQANSGFLTKPPTQSEYGVGDNYVYAFGNQPLDQDGKQRRAAIWGPKMEGQLVPQWDSPLNENGIRQGTPFVSKGADNLKNFVQTGWLTVNNVNIGTSNDKSDFRVSLTNQRQVGIWPNTSINFNNLQLNGGHALTEKLKVRSMLNVNMQNSENIPDANYGPNSYAYDFGVYAGAWYDVRDLKDYWLIDGVQQLNREYGRTNNPWFIANEWLRSHRKNDMYGYVSLSYDINKYSQVLVRTQATFWDAMRTEKRPVSAEIYDRPNRAGDYMEDRRSLFESNTDVLYTYNREVKDFHIGGLIGGTVRDFNYNSSWATTNDLVVPGVYNFTNSRNPVFTYDYRSRMLVLSGYSSIDLGYKNYVKVNATGHWDKLSTLPVGEQNYFYPSVSVSSILTNYLRNEIPKFISFAKVRGSYAQVQGGLTQNNMGPAYMALGVPHPLGPSIGGPWFTSYDGPSYQNQNLYSISPSYNNLPGANFTNNIANPNLKPFNVTAYETGIDMMFLKNRLGFDFTYFLTYNGPQIYVRDLSPSTGYYQTNINDVVTKKDGFEVALKGTPILKKDFRWDVLANYSSFIEKYHEINDPSGSVLVGGNAFRVGDRVDAIYDTEYLRDPNGNIIHGLDGLPLAPRTGPIGRTFVGFGRSTFAWAINNKFQYKNWGLSFQFDGRVGGVFYNYMKNLMYRGGTHQDLNEGAMGAARNAEWESVKADGKVTPSYTSQGVKLVSGTIKYNEDGTISNYDELVFEQNDKAVALQAYAIHISGINEDWYQSRTYTMLREVRLSYHFPTKMLAKAKIEKASFSLVGRNLLYFAAGKEMNMDQYTGYEKQQFGVRSTDNPSLQTATTRNFGFNLNIQF